MAEESMTLRMATAKVRVIETPRYAGHDKEIGYFSFARIPVKGDYLYLPTGKALVDYVCLFTDGDVTVVVNTSPR